MYAIDVALHFALDMSGAITFSCLIGLCKNPKHNHGRILRWTAANPWKVQSIAALILALITVRVLG